MTTPYVDPSQPDPRFPNRPTHPDFAQLSDAVQANDFESENGRWKERGSEFVDFDSLEYLVVNRAMKLAEARGLDPAIIAGAIIDGFVLGCAYSRTREVTQ